jgi:FSR family fosmidomycin resistance protein-like MFS transporter
MNLLLDRIFFSVALGHLTTDFVSGQRYVLLTYMIGLMGLSNTSLGFVSMMFMLVASLSQPLFGLITDRYGPRWVIFGGLVWLGSFYTLGLLIPGTLGLFLFVLSSIGSGAFHPAGTMVATERGNKITAGKETTATAVFFLFGQIGLFIGPLVAGIVLDTADLFLLALIASVVIPVALNALLRLRNFRPDQVKTELGEIRDSKIKYSTLLLLVFAAVAAFPSWSQQNMVTFIPKYLSDLGQSPGTYGLFLALYMAGFAFGNLAGGYLADRFGKWRVATLMLALGSIPLILIPIMGWSYWLYLLVPLAGTFTGATFSIIVVLAQKIIPGGKGFSSGLILGFIFASGAIGTMFSGYLADLKGIESVFVISAGLMLLASGLSILLRRTEAIPMNNH